MPPIDLAIIGCVLKNKPDLSTVLFNFSRPVYISLHSSHRNDLIIQKRS